MADYGETYYDGGLLRFDGVRLDGKAIKKITVNKKTDDRWAECEYQDGHKYKVSAKHSVDGDNEVLSDISEVWT